MAKRKDPAAAVSWPEQPEAGGAAFNGGDLWIGEHTVDKDILVFDPGEADAAAERIAFYSLAQHRMRTFPRAAVVKMIRAVTDELGSARARKDYARRAELLVAHQGELAAGRSERDEHLRQGVIAAHQRHLAGLGIAYEGVRDTDPDKRHGRRTRCHACGISLDDFANSACGVCDGVLCSCGACACGGPTRKSATTH